MPRTFLACALAALLLQGSVQDPSLKENSGPTQKSTPSQSDAPDPATIKKLIRQLGDAEYTERNAAMKRLQAIGKPALPALREAVTNSSEPEIKRRAQRLIERIAPQVD